VVVSFSGRAAHGGEISDVTFSAVVDGELVGRDYVPAGDELTDALAAPAWARYGTFTGQPLIKGEVVWSVGERRVVIRGRRGGARFEECLP
jgi:hypothetical protein